MQAGLRAEYDRFMIPQTTVAATDLRIWNSGTDIEGSNRWRMGGGRAGWPRMGHGGPGESWGRGRFRCCGFDLIRSCGGSFFPFFLALRQNLWVDLAAVTPGSVESADEEGLGNSMGVSSRRRFTYPGLLGLTPALRGKESTPSLSCTTHPYDRIVGERLRPNQSRTRESASANGGSVCAGTAGRHGGVRMRQLNRCPDLVALELLDPGIADHGGKSKVASRRLLAEGPSMFGIVLARSETVAYGTEVRRTRCVHLLPPPRPVFSVKRGAKNV